MKRFQAAALLAAVALATAPGRAQTAAPAPPRSAPSAPASRPSLVVLLIVDQLRGGMLEEAAPALSGGLKRLLDSGRRFTRCYHDHAGTETGPGHATLVTGCHPSRNGVILNDWHDRESGRSAYCAGADRPDAPLSFDGGPAISSASLKAETLADALRRSEPAARIFTLSGKDRSAALTAGKGANGVFWFSVRTGGFTSHPFFGAALPAWGSEFWADDLFSSGLFRLGLPAEWTYPIRAAARVDGYPYEGDGFSRTTPHPLREPAPTATTREERMRQMTGRLFNSPWLDWLTLELAGRIVEKERLGADAVPDLLVVGLTATDTVGHIYGPGSQEHLDHLVRLDGWLGSFMKRADAEAGRGGVLYALSADHGVMPLPETEPGMRRIDLESLKERFEAAMSARLGEGPFLEAIHRSHLYLDRRTLRRLRIPLGQAVEHARRVLSSFWDVARVYRAADLQAPPGGDPMLDLHRNSWTPERGGDLVIAPCEGCLVTSRPYGTSHGSPWEYDRHVAMILMGPGVRPGADDGRCRTVDLAPTLAQRLGVSFDSPRDGRPLPFARVVDSTGPRQ